MPVENYKTGTLSRRSFLKTTAAISGAAAVAGGVGLAAKEPALAEGEEKLFTSRCMWGGCQNCRQIVHVRDGKVVKTEPNPTESRGNRMCLRGYGQIQRAYNPNRLKYPLKRKTWTQEDPHVENRGKDEWEQITWDEAIEAITTKWKSLIVQYGSHSIAVYSAAGSMGVLKNYVGRFCNMMQFTQFDSSLDLAVSKGAAQVLGGQGWGILGNDVPDSINISDRVVVWGENASESKMQLYREYLDAQDKYGTRIIDIDPVQTTLAISADEWIPIRPASDAALALGAMNYIFANGLENKPFLVKNTNGPHLVRKDTRHLLHVEDAGLETEDTYYGVVWDEDLQAAVPANQATNPALSGTFVVNGIECETCYDVLRNHVAQYTPEWAAEQCDVTVDVVKHVAELYTTGNVTSQVSMGAQSYNNGVQYGFAVVMLAVICGQVGRLGAGFKGCFFMMSFNMAASYPTGTFTNYVSILKFPEIMEKQTYRGEPYVIKSIWCWSANFVAACCDSSKTRKAMDGLELVVTQDLAFTDTARLSDFVLPVNHLYEQEDFLTTTTIRSILWADKCIEPPYECKGDADITKLLAAGMGVGDFFTMSNEEFMALSLDASPYKELSITVENLRKQGEMQWGDWVISMEDGVYSTPCGKAQLFYDVPESRSPYLKEFDEKTEQLPHWQEPLEAWPTSDAYKKYQIILMSERARYRLQTVGWDVPWFQELEPEPTVRVNNEDAAARGIKDGDYIRMWNDRGSLVAKAQLSACLRPGVAVYPKGLQAHQFKTGVSFSDLSTNEFDAMGVNSNFFDAVVEYEKWEGGNN